MRRVLASLLLSLFSFTLIAPAALRSLDSNLPECCRKDGKHKCAMGSSQMSELGDAGWHSVAEKCPRPTTQSATRINETAPAPDTSTLSIAAASTHGASVVQTEARYRASFSRTRQKRGPPSLL